MDVAPPVKPEYGPSLPELLRAHLPRRARTALAVAVAAAVAIGVAALLLGRGSDGQSYVHATAPQFNLRYAPQALRPVSSPGAILKLEGRRGTLFLQSMEVRPLRLPAYRGSASGILPLFATRHVAELATAHRYRGFEPLGEGKARINDVPGYQVGFKAKLGSRTLWGRDVFLVPDLPGARDGVVITLLQTPAAGASSAETVAAMGALKKPLRSFRFGTEAP